MSQSFFVQNTVYIHIKMILKIFDLKKGNRDRVVSKPSDSSLVKKEREQVKIKRYAGMDGNFLSHAHYRDPFFGISVVCMG